MFGVLSLVVLGLVSCDILEPFWLSDNLGDSNIVGDNSKCEGRFKMWRGTKKGSKLGRLMLGIFEEQLGKADFVDDFEDQMAS